MKKGISGRNRAEMGGGLKGGGMKAEEDEDEDEEECFER